MNAYTYEWRKERKSNLFRKRRLHQKLQKIGMGEQLRHFMLLSSWSARFAAVANLAIWMPKRASDKTRSASSRLIALERHQIRRQKRVHFEESRGD